MLLGLLVCGPIVAAEGVPAGLHGEAWLWLGLSGGGNILGLFLSYHAMRRGQVSIVAPLTSTEGSIAALIAVAAGESLSAATAVALILATIGVVVTSIPGEQAPGSNHSFHFGTISLAVAAAIIFGVSLYATGRAAAVLPSAWVVLSARAIGTVVVSVPLILRRQLKITRKAAPFVATSGMCEVAGFFSYTFGTHHGLAVAAVLASQFAAISAGAAYFLFGERLTRLQLAGVCTILVGVSLLSAVNA